MKTKISIALILGILLLSTGIGLTSVSAADWTNLPATAVQLSVVDGSDTYFISTLSGVPAGYSVDNGEYPGWCIDNSENMERSTNHDVMLYSSLNPPAALSGIQWGAINYILNHKQGTMNDVQNAIWYFTNGGSVSGTAQTMVTEALANLNYDPSTTCGAILAIICYDENADNGVQNTIIELQKPCIPGLSPGFWKHNIAVALGINPGSYSSPYEGAPKITESDLLNYVGMTTFAGLPEAYNALSANGKGSASIRLDACNQFNAAAGYTPYND